LVLEKLDKIGWKKEVKKCFKENYPHNCPKNSLFPVSKFATNYCGYYSYCSRVNKFR